MSKTVSIDTTNMTDNERTAAMLAAILKELPIKKKKAKDIREENRKTEAKRKENRKTEAKRKEKKKNKSKKYVRKNFNASYELM